VLVHVVNEVHAVDKTDILHSYVKVEYVVLCVLTSLKLLLCMWFSTNTHCFNDHFLGNHQLPGILLDFLSPPVLG